MASVTKLLTGIALLGDVVRHGLVGSVMLAHLRQLAADERSMAAWNLARCHGRTGHSREGFPPKATPADLAFLTADPFFVLHGVAAVLWTFD